MATERGSALGRAKPLVAARMLSALISTCIPLVFARTMGLVEYGSYKQLFLIAQTLQLILPFGMVQSLYFFVPRSTQRRPHYAGALAFLGLGGLVALVLCVAGAAPAARYFGNPELFQLRWALGLYIAGLLGSFPLEIALTSEGRTRASAVTYLISDSIRAAVMVLPVLLGYGLRGALEGLAAFSLARWVLTLVVLLGKSEGPLWSWRTLRDQLRYAAPSGAATLISRPTQYAHQYALSSLLGPGPFGIYSVGCFQLPLVDLLYTPTSEVLMVRLGELEREGRGSEAVRVFREASAKLAVFFLPLAALLWAAAPDFIAALFGPRFLGAVPVFRVSVGAILLSVLPIDGALRGSNQTRHFFTAAVLKAVVMLPLVYLGVTRFGMMGGIVAWLVGESFGKLVLFIRVPEALSGSGARVPYRALVPWRALGRVALAALIGACATVALRLIAGPRVAELPAGFVWRALPLAADGMAFGLACGAALWALGVAVPGLGRFLPQRSSLRLAT